MPSAAHDLGVVGWICLTTIWLGTTILICRTQLTSLRMLFRYLERRRAALIGEPAASRPDPSPEPKWVDVTDHVSDVAVHVGRLRLADPKAEPVGMPLAQHGLAVPFGDVDADAVVRELAKRDMRRAGINPLVVAR